jgi:hypothetical protein
MATAKQIQANRNNAKKSTGPRTEEGKARVAQNALKHGLLAGDAVLPGEDPAEFEAQLAALEADIQPVGALERELVRQIADAQWRMRRLSRLETAYLIAALDNKRERKAMLQPRPLHYSDEENTLMLGYSLFHHTPSLGHFARYDAHLGRRFERAVQQIAHLREAREKHRNTSTDTARHTPARSVHATAPSPRPDAQTPASEDCETNPIPSNSNEINNIAATNPPEFRPARSDSHRNPPQPARAWPDAIQVTPNGGSGSPHGALPK